ncbi:MAG: phenylacetate--CoA ligase, partial [Methanocorpusculum sp.]|nr:phenylacetate--CoA ligase [Methanocorpusculum sp.]
MPYYNEKIETMPKDELAKLQYQELKKLVTRLYDSSVFYHTKMAESGVKPADITSITDITKLPFMKKTDLRDNYPDGLVCVPHEDLVRYHV